LRFAGPISRPPLSALLYFIYHLADALGRLKHYTFPFELNAVTRVELAGLAGAYPPEKAALMNAVLKEPPDQEAIAKYSGSELR